MSETTNTSTVSEQKTGWYILKELHRYAEQVDTKLRAAMNSLDVAREPEVKRLQSTVSTIVGFASNWNDNLIEENRDLIYQRRKPPPEKELSGDFVDNFYEALGSVKGFIEAAITLPGSPPEVAAQIRNAAVDEERDLRAAFDAFLRSLAGFVVDVSADEISPLNVAEIEKYRGKIFVDRAAEEARVARDQAVKAARDSEEAAGQSGTSSLALHFGQRAQNEAVSANLFRIAAIFVLITLTAIASYWVFAVVPSSQSIVKDLTKLVITIPLGVLAAYMGRESSRHRAHSVWSRDIEVQLRTLEAYIAPLPDVERSQLRAEFGKRVFGTRSAAAAAAAAESSQASLPQIAELIAKMGEVVKPGPSK